MPLIHSGKQVWTPIYKPLISLEVFVKPAIYVQHLANICRKRASTLRRTVSPYSKPGTLAKLDGRTREARIMAGVRAELLKQVGVTPTPVLSALIDRAAWLTLHVAMLDAKVMAGGGYPVERDGRQYLAWSNTLTRTLAAIGIKGAPPAVPDLKTYLESRIA